MQKYQKMNADDLLPHMHNVTIREAETIFFDLVRRVIFEEH